MRRPLCRSLLLAVLLALAVVGHRPEEFYQVFLAQFTARLGGTPLYLATSESDPCSIPRLLSQLEPAN